MCSGRDGRGFHRVPDAPVADGGEWGRAAEWTEDVGRDGRRATGASREGGRCGRSSGDAPARSTHASQCGLTRRDAPVHARGTRTYPEGSARPRPRSSAPRTLNPTTESTTAGVGGCVPPGKSAYRGRGRSLFGGAPRTRFPFDAPASSPALQRAGAALPVVVACSRAIAATARQCTTLPLPTDCRWRASPREIPGLRDVEQLTLGSGFSVPDRQGTRAVRA